MSHRHIAIMSTDDDLPVTTTRARSTAPRAPLTRLGDEAVRRLVRRANDGDQRAWNELVAQFSGLVWSVTRAYGLNNADAADISQTTWQLLVEHLDRLHDPARVGAWLATTARRQCIQQQRSTSRLIPHGADLPDQSSQTPPPDTALLTKERDLALCSALADLPPNDRRLLHMLIADPTPSYAQISAALEIPTGSIGPTRARALARLRRKARHHGLSHLD
jgi:RNA polymerase sigma factor (sigma-70 family)